MARTHFADCSKGRTSRAGCRVQSYALNRLRGALEGEGENETLTWEFFCERPSSALSFSLFIAPNGAVHAVSSTVYSYSTLYTHSV